MTEQRSQTKLRSGSKRDCIFGSTNRIVQPHSNVKPLQRLGGLATRVAATAAQIEPKYAVFAAFQPPGLYNSRCCSDTPSAQRNKGAAG